jgi:Na+/proline symporter/signal transduction histidine kinase
MATSMIDVGVLFGTSLLYLCLLFVIAHGAESNWFPRRLVRHPWVYTLSLGVYATTWTYYGSVGLAESDGYLFLTIYLGTTLAFIATPFLLSPLFRLARDYQLTSLADLFAFRYRSQSVGVLVTLVMLMGAIPYISLQIRAVTESFQILASSNAGFSVSLWFCMALILFSILFGARHISPREKHQGLVVAIAFESLVKLVALLSVGAAAVFGVFDGPAGLNRWLAAHPEALERLYAPMREGPWFTLALLSFAAAFLLPRQFHMIITENFSLRSLSFASWAFPLFLLLLNLAIPPVLWAGIHLDIGLHPDYFVLGVAMAEGGAWLSVVAFIGGVSAASAMVIVTTLALSNMCLNHLVLPASYPDPRVNLYAWLLWGRRLLIALIILGGYNFYHHLQQHQGLVEMGLISFVAVAQFLPGIFGLLFWRRANRTGFMLGLCGGILVWATTLLIPLLTSSTQSAGWSLISESQTLMGMDKWEFATFWSLAVNSALFALGASFSRQSQDESDAARTCVGEGAPPLSGVVMANSPRQFRVGLAAILGEQTAAKEVAQALRDLDMEESEGRPAELRRLRERIERNLSGLMGPQMAHMIINQQLELDSAAKTALADSMRYIEERLEESRSRQDDLSTDLDSLRRYHHRILLDLPLGVCAAEADRRVAIWNPALEVISGIPSHRALGQPLKNLPQPWSGLLSGFAQSRDDHIHHLETEIEGRKHWFNLHKAELLSISGQERGGVVMLLEDLTDLETLEAELAHSDRLASVGRLAAGLAHEIGNPITGIDSLAQNLRHEEDGQVIRESVEDILIQTRRVSHILRTMMNFSRSGRDNRPESLRLCELIRECVDLVNLSRKQHRIDVNWSCDEGITLVGDRQQLSQVLVNLLTNAVDASPSEASVELFVFHEGAEIRIEIHDHGEGIKADHLEMIFEPFFTTKGAGRGTGLGLPLAHGIVAAHGGRIEIDSQRGVGTRISVTLPSQPDKTALPPRSTS